MKTRMKERMPILFIATVGIMMTSLMGGTMAEAAPRQQAGGKWGSCSSTPSPLCGGVTCTDEFGNGWCCATKDSDPKTCTLVSQPANQLPGRMTVPKGPRGPMMQGGVMKRGVEGEQPVAPAPSDAKKPADATAK